MDSDNGLVIGIVEEEATEELLVRSS